MNYTHSSSRLLSTWCRKQSKEQEKLVKAEGIQEREHLTLNPNSMFDERFEAVMVDMLAGRHISQTKPQSPGLFELPEDHETGDDDPTSDF